jgi:hypothetical protein
MPGVRPAVYRRAKYEKKINADVVRQRFADLKDTMVTQTDERFSELVDAENAAKGILHEAGVPTIDIPFYLDVVRELYRLTRRFSGPTLQAEAQLVRQKWVSRGLLDDVIVKLLRLFGIVPPAY